MPTVQIEELGKHGIIKDIPPHRLPDNAWTNGNHVRFDVGGAKQVNNERPVLARTSGAAVLSNVTWLQQFPSEESPLWMFSDRESAAAAGDGSVYVIATDGAYSDISRLGAGLGNYNTIATERPNGGMFQGLGFWNNNEDIPQQWDTVSAAVLLKDMPAWAISPETANLWRAKFIRAYKNFLVTGYLDTTLDGGGPLPYRIRWSNAAVPGSAPADFDVANPASLAGQRDLADTADYLVDARVLGEIMVIYKQRTTWGMQVIQSNDIMRTWQIFPRIGLLWRDCVAAFPGGHLVATHDDIIMHNGTRGSEKSILEDRMRDHVFNKTLNRNQIRKCYMVENIPQDEIWFCYPAGGAIIADTALLWNWKNGSLGIRALRTGGAEFGAAGIVVDTSTAESGSWNP